MHLRRVETAATSLVQIPARIFHNVASLKNGVIHQPVLSRQQAGFT